MQNAQALAQTAQNNRTCALTGRTECIKNKVVEEENKKGGPRMCGCVCLGYYRLED